MSENNENFNDRVDENMDSDNEDFVREFIDFEEQENNNDLDDMALYEVMAVDDEEQLVFTDSDESESNASDFSENALTESDDENRNVVEEGSLCEHYKRRCKLVCPHCDKDWNCRLCHDDEVFDHQLDRFAVKEVVCVQCNLRQKVSNKCKKCNVKFGEYACLKCNLFDDRIEKGQFHCDKCGLCRVGGKDKFFHCDKCGTCLALETKATHTCIEHISRQNCPICQEYMHTSVVKNTIMKCGHMVHSSCFKQIVNQGQARCPTCLRSVVDMSKVWQRLDRHVLMTPMPKEYENKWKSNLCNDCQKVTHCKFHVVAMKCQECGSYNTAEVGEWEPPKEEESTEKPPENMHQN